MKKIIALTAIALGLAFSGQALAHGAKAKHGGIVQSAADLSFELVAKDGKAVIYVDDHDEELLTAGASGTLTVLSGTSKSELTLVPAGTNTLVTKEDVKLAAGAKAVASITLPGKEAISVRFAKKK
jgi:hypothetical protein